ncbi:MAG: ABC transporter substrate-binding protein [Lentisphaerales bacterium]|nr:ABC transporter substrate-binding protein [Lentisphaerales bacterium]
MLTPKFILSILLILLSSTTFAEYRLITLGSNATETVFALGLGDKVVARDYGSTFPKAVNDLPSLGQGHKIKAEEILKHNPTHIVVWDKRASNTGVIEKLKKAFVQIVELGIKDSTQQTEENIKAVAKAFGKEAEGEKLIAKVQSDIQKVSEYNKTKKNSPNAIFIYARGIGTLFLAGQGSSAQTLLELAGAQPAVKGFHGFKPVNAETIIEADPEVVMLFHSGLESLGGQEKLAEVPGLKLTKALKNGKIVAIDDRALNFGPRIGLFAMELAQKLQGDLEPTAKVNE